MNKIYYVQSSWEDSPKVFTDSREKAEKYLLAYGEGYRIEEVDLNVETDNSYLDILGYSFKYRMINYKWSMNYSDSILENCELEIDTYYDAIVIVVPKEFAKDILEAYNVAEYMFENRDIPNIVEHMKNLKLGAQLCSEKSKEKGVEINVL